MNRRAFLRATASLAGGLAFQALQPLAAGAGVLSGASALGTVGWFAGEHPPAGWLFCEGQALAIRHHMALYSLLGTRYGGDGRETFRLPDYRDPTRPGFHQGFGPPCPLKAIICTMGIFPERA